MLWRVFVTLLMSLILASVSQAQLANTKIAFASSRDGNDEIYVMNSDGTNPINLTNNSSTDGCPSWSPDGTKIAFFSDRDGDNEIYVMNADGTGITQLTNNSGYDVCPAWSPDGLQIVFQAAPNVSTATDIWVMNANGTNAHLVITNGDAPSWSPDGTKIAFASIRSGNNEVWVMNADGTNLVNLTNNGAPGDGNPKWSPDGKKIVFSTTPPGGNGDIYVMNADGTNLIQLTTDGSMGQSPPGDDSNPYWSPDGTKIVFSSYRDGNYEIYIMNADGTNPTRLTNNAVVDQQPSWSPFLNAPPMVGAIIAPVDPVQVNTAINTNANFTDMDTSDTHTALWNWGDNSTSPGTVTETNGSGSVTGNHTYTAAGVYTVTLTVTDNSGASGQAVFQYVVIYDPSAGFVTGGGWIDSPPLAYTSNPLLTGKANFGFVSKYQKGATTPSGQTQFSFRVAELNFHSTSYQWLVVSGAKAQFKGLGTINSSGDYGFLLTATDGQINGGGGVDKFRIKIWDKATNTVVYDNQTGAADDADATQAIAGGSIVIHSDSSAAPPLSIIFPSSLSTLLPKVTSLGAAFPNPFNPETWIPYELAKDVKVTIRVYNVSGLLIRTLDLGYKAAGYYTNKDKAAYWDGKMSMVSEYQAAYTSTLFKPESIRL